MSDSDRGAETYELLGEVAEGLTFTVERCRRVRDGYPAVAKLPRRALAPPRQEDILRHEYGILTALAEQRPVQGIARAIDFADIPGRGSALILEDAGRVNLSDWLGHRAPDLATSLPIAIAIARAVAGVHAHMVLNRDISPFNIVIGHDNHPTIVDFGTATRVLGVAPAEVPTGPAAALLYQAPEQTGRMSRGVDQRADLYAVGATLYELFTGAPPFPYTDPVELVHAHLARKPVAASITNPRLPPVVSDIVLKLLAKAPEQRYQSAEALLADLEQVERRRVQTGQVTRFEIGGGDRRPLALPSRLYGRHEELDRLGAALASAASGGRETVIVRGPAGSGKSALVDELARGHEGRATFGIGSACQVRGNVPFVPWTEVLRPPIRRIRDAPAAQKTALVDELATELGGDAHLLFEMIPELRELVSVPTSAGRPGAAELEARFKRAVVALVRCVARKSRPLVLFLDDLQWADPGSLELFVTVAREPELPYLLLVAAMRSEPAGAASAEEALEGLRAAGVSVTDLELTALDEQAVTQLIADALEMSAGAVRSLSRAVARKTAGNALFVRRFLREIYLRGWLRADASSGAWSWDTSQVEKAASTENVVAFMLESIRRLPAETQALLQIVACFRGLAELDVVARVADTEPDVVAGRLWSAVREGLLVGEEDPARGVRYRFEHDKVQEAAYTRLRWRSRDELHVAIGRCLRARQRQGVETDLFEIVDQFDRGAAHIERADERRDVAALSAEAARRARDGNAYRSALEYARRGLSLLGGDRAWEADRELAYRLHWGAAEAGYLTGDDAAADELVAAAKRQELSPRERARLANLQVIAAATRGRMAEAIERGREGLVALGVHLPETDEGAWRGELGRVRERLAGAGAEKLAELPYMRDPVQLAVMELLANMISPAYVTSPELLALLVGRMVNISVEHGSSVDTAFATACLGMVVGALQHDADTAYRLGRAGAALAERFDDAVQECRTLHIVGCFLNHWRAPLRTNVPILRRAVRRGVEGGELQFAIYAAGTIIVARFHSGEPLDEISAEIDSFSALAARAQAKAGQEYLLAYRQAVRCFQGATESLSSFDDEDFKEAPHLAASADNPLSLALYQVLRLLSSYLAGDVDAALPWAESASRSLQAVGGVIPVGDHRFLFALALAARGGEGAVAAIRPHHEQLRRWAAGSPDSYRRKELIVEAELARLEGDVLTAAARYDEAIDAAAEVGDARDEAIACELAARLWRSQKRRRLASPYLRQALDRYARWGATAKVASLEEERAEDLAAMAVPPPGISLGTEGASLDLMALHKAYESLSSEIVLDRLLDKLMSVSMEVAGATGAALFIESEGELALRIAAPADNPPAVPRGLIESVRDGNSPLAIGDSRNASEGPALAAVREGPPRSILAVPIPRKSTAIGVLYLENRLTTHAFTGERVRVLSLLASQVASALENSLLFEDLRREIAERKRAEESVRFLADASVKLHESLDAIAIAATLVRLPIPVMAQWAALYPCPGSDTPLGSAILHPPAVAEFGLLEPGTGTPVTGSVQRARETEAAVAVDVTGAERSSVPPGTRGIIAVPLVASAGRIGVLVCGATRPYREADRILVRELAHRASIALEKAQLYAQSQEAVSARDEFLSIASHELKTPLTSLQLAAQGLSRGVLGDLDTAALARVAGIVDRQTGQLSRLVGDLLDVSRLHAGRLRLAFDKVDLEGVVRDVLERFESQPGAQAVSVASRAGGPVIGCWDRARLDQVVTNLVSNALKFGEGRPIQIEITADERRARLMVTDHGIGIPPERLHAIFGRFERAVPASRYGGIGLGLYISNRIVTALGGTIRAESEVGHGTRFLVEIPLERDPANGVD